eukprot:gb/GEZN01009100.1/.p1 GENE.gb/GEZN01009100.1/~~gb/GEZN01009100.1/.p1  ORF type:complete len:408 (+),score=77.83 gb/GEZN01009100.1/:42-1226(+)
MPPKRKADATGAAEKKAKITETSPVKDVSDTTSIPVNLTDAWKKLPKVALITGITGQDGSYLSEYLMSQGYEVHGIIRRSSSFNTGRIDHIYKDQHVEGAKLFLHYGDLTDANNLAGIMTKVRPREVYNLGAQSHVAVSFDMAEYTAQTDGVGTLRLLDAIRMAGLSGHTRFYQASTSELYGKVQEIPQKETTPFYPRSPYGVAKLYAYWICVNYRESYNMHVNNGILFNHESPRRGPTFVTRKITRAVARIKKGMQDCMYLGNINSERDWGHAKDYVKAMWLMLQNKDCDDYVVATGVKQTVRSCVEEAFSVVDIKITWEGEGVDEVGKTPDGKVVVRIDPKYYRPAEVDLLIGDPSKIKKQLGWKTEITFKELIKEMVDCDLADCGKSALKW